MKLSVYSHPSTIVLVDDSPTFLRSLGYHLGSQPCRSFSDTTEALVWLHASPRRTGLPLRVSFDMHGQQADQRNIAIDVERIHRIASQQQRFAIPSVLVVDYSMPQMSGIDFFKAVQHLPCKKILFTGTGDEKIAVDAFNRGLIDRYIRKNDRSALDLLEREIHVLQQAFFLDRSETLRDMLALHDYGFLRCPQLAAVVRELYEMRGFVEHYVFPKPAGIMFCERNGKATLMIIETADSLQAQYEMARDSGAPVSLLQALQDKRIVPFFSQIPGNDGMYSAEVGERWHRYCNAPQICRGAETYYWALFDVPPHLLDSPVFAFERHGKDAAPQPSMA
ncbi:hypothetical protein [Pseudoduganella violacea]|uniref:CheY-like chemotaxis protein n=1 Tax=Pseudoduganella violacea TaxID=1715466 RepID=A0A7W5B774_9BURK|nr:hypothetical protein [Pseudoduganella violacea]MBB3117792.1 CheY-like chemotaxis protein [Pseudoduganella violacea]